MNTIRSVIIEDSRLARQELFTLLQAHPEIEIQGQAGTVGKAFELIQEIKPQLIFLDIQLPDGSGFDLLERLVNAPEVVFTTAYDEYALKSFEYSALDYLLKPIRSERLAAAVEQIHKRLGENSSNMDLSSRVFVKDGEKCWLLKLAEIRLFEVIGNYSRIYFGENRAMIPKPLNYLEQRLDPSVFFRANRQHLVNLKYVDQIEPGFNGKLLLKLKQGSEEIEVSRRQAARFREILSF